MYKGATSGAPHIWNYNVNQIFMHTKKITEKGQIWEGFLFLFVIAFVIAGFSYFFIYKFGGVPVIKKPSGGPAERGVLPQGTFFKNTAPKNSEKDKDLLPYQPIKLLGVFGNTARAATCFCQLIKNGKPLRQKH